MREGVRGAWAFSGVEARPASIFESRVCPVRCVARTSSRENRFAREGAGFAGRAFGPLAFASPGGGHSRVLRCPVGAMRFIALEVSHLAPPSQFNPQLTICESKSSRAPVAGSPFVLLAARVLAQAVISGWRLTLVAFAQSAVRFDLKADSLDGPRAFSRLALRAGPCTTVRRRVWP